MRSATTRTRVLLAPGRKCFVRWSFLGVLALSAGTLLSAGAFAQGVGSTSGRVADVGHVLRGVVTLDRVPLSNVVVELTLACDPLQAEGRERCGHPRRAFTDEEGRLLIEGLAAGTHDVLVKCPDSDERFRTDVGVTSTLESDSTSESDFILDCHAPPPIPPSPPIRGKIRWAR